MQLFNVLQVFAAFLETWFPKFLSSQLFGDLRQSFENALKVGKNSTFLLTCCTYFDSDEKNFLVNKFPNTTGIH